MGPISRDLPSLAPSVNLCSRQLCTGAVCLRVSQLQTSMGVHVHTVGSSSVPSVDKVTTFTFTFQPTCLSQVHVFNLLLLTPRIVQAPPHQIIVCPRKPFSLSMVTASGMVPARWLSQVQGSLLHVFVFLLAPQPFQSPGPGASPPSVFRHPPLDSGLSCLGDYKSLSILEELLCPVLPLLVYPLAAVPTHSDTRDWFHGRQFYHRPGGGMVLG